ncbi:MAG: universal stress protein [Alphaproteobacteria bacterium]|nr:universal stress protein [Alphaproteobacteria bacterium]
MFDQVVVGISFEAHWSGMDELAAALARGLGVDVTLVHVGPDRGELLALGWDALVRRPLEDAGVRASFTWRDGDVVDALLQVCGGFQEPLLLVGASTVHDPRRGFLGGTTLKLLMDGRVSVVTIPTALTWTAPDRPLRVVYASDLTDISTGWMTRAGQLADALDAELHLTHVVPIPRKAFLHPSDRHPIWDEQLEIERSLKWLAAHELSGRSPHKVHAIAHRSVPHGILDEVEALEADLIVLGTRRGRYDNRIGSVAQALLRLSPVPVLVLGD